MHLPLKEWCCWHRAIPFRGSTIIDHLSRISHSLEAQSRLILATNLLIVGFETPSILAASAWVSSPASKHFLRGGTPRANVQAGINDLAPFGVIPSQ